VEPQEEPRSALARRLRMLRTDNWPDRPITQKQLASALVVSVPLISSWENETNPTLPPAARLRKIATLFATRRSLSGTQFRPVADSDLLDEERAVRADLEDELLDLREQAASNGLAAQHGHRFRQVAEDAVGGGPLHYPDGRAITIVCAPFAPDFLEKMKPYTDRNAPDYAPIYNYADLDALVELHGHVRATNPQSEVRIRLASDVSNDDITSHLLLLGGVDWNGLTRDVFDVLDLPVVQAPRQSEESAGGFQVGEQTFSPRMRRSSQGIDVLAEDVAHFYRAPSPFNRKRSVTIFNGMYGRGTYGAVRALTDANFRDRNTEFLEDLLEDAESVVSILCRVQIVRGEVLTPDWTLRNARLHILPEVVS
jgi:transcriptional regulator with XRE-family HTH domain